MCPTEPAPRPRVCGRRGEGKEPATPEPGRGAEHTGFIISILQNARGGRTFPAGKSLGKSRLPLQGPEPGIFPGLEEPAPPANKGNPQKQRRPPRYDRLAE